MQACMARFLQVSHGSTPTREIVASNQVRGPAGRARCRVASPGCRRAAGGTRRRWCCSGGKPTPLATPLTACCEREPNACGGRGALPRPPHWLLHEGFGKMCAGGGGATAARCKSDVVSWSGAGAGMGTEWTRHASKRRSAAEAGQAALHEGHARATRETLTTICAAQPRCRAWPHCGHAKFASGPGALGQTSQWQTRHVGQPEAVSERSMPRSHGGVLGTAAGGANLKNGMVSDLGAALKSTWLRLTSCWIRHWQQTSRFGL